MHFSLTYRCQKSRTETKNSLLVWHQICAAVQFSQRSPCSLWLPSTPAAALQVSPWHAAALDVFLLSFTTELFFFLCVTHRIILQDRNVRAGAWDITFLSETHAFHTNWKNFKHILMCSGSPRTNKSQQEPQAEEKTTFCHCWHTYQNWTISCCSFCLFFTIAAVSSRRERQRARAMASTHRHSC